MTFMADFGKMATSDDKGFYLIAFIKSMYGTDYSGELKCPYFRLCISALSIISNEAAFAMTET